MIIAAMAIGADEGYVYVRMEYPLAVERMKLAAKQAEEAGVLGENIFNSGKNFNLTIMEGAGAFVCGEETALMSSIEGNVVCQIQSLHSQLKRPFRQTNSYQQR